MSTRTPPTSLQALILDWAGTVVDFGSFAPTEIFVDAFRDAYGFDITLQEARRPMGLGKWQHIEALSQDPDISARWQEKFGRAMGVSDIDHIYKTFIPLQIERVGAHSQLIPGALESLSLARERGLRIGSTTGYPRAVMQRLTELARALGYEPDCVVCADDLTAGARPGPYMALDCVQQLKATAVWRCVKVDDTPPGLEEGRNAGMWTVAVALSGSPAGWTCDEYLHATEEQRQAVRARVTPDLLDAGAHLVIDTIADLGSALDQIEMWLSEGRRP